jgi:hypothetical protein
MRPLTKIWIPFGIDIEDLSGGLRLLTITKPKQRLAETTFTDLYKILEELWRQILGEDMEKFWRRKKNARFLEKLDELYLVLNREDQIVGFNGWFLAGDMKHINICVDLIGVLPQIPVGEETPVDFGPEFLQKTIIGRAYKRYEDWRAKTIFVTTRTQNPVVYQLARRIVVAGSLYPDTDGNKPPNEVLSCAQDYAEKLGIKKEKMGRQAKVIGEDLIWKNSYNPPLYRRRDGDPAAFPEDEEFRKIDTFFREKLGERDAFILVGRPNIEDLRIQTELEA